MWDDLKLAFNFHASLYTLSCKDIPSLTYEHVNQDLPTTIVRCYDMLNLNSLIGQMLCVCHKITGSMCIE